MSLFLSTWKQCVLHQGSSFNLKSSLEVGLAEGGKESWEGRQTVFSTPLDLWRDEFEEKFQSDLSKQEKGSTFWQTKSHATTGLSDGAS